MVTPPVHQDRLSPHTLEDHLSFLHGAIGKFDANPYRVEWNYVHAAFKAHGGNISATARYLGVQRRTIQRILMKREPV